MVERISEAELEAWDVDCYEGTLITTCCKAAPDWKNGLSGKVLPRLIAEVRALREENDRLKGYSGGVEKRGPYPAVLAWRTKSKDGWL